MSSRNNYLNATQKEQAVILYKMLQKTASSIEQEVNPDFSALEQNAQANIANAGLQPDYFSICQARTLKPAQPGDRNLIILTAAYLDKTRLIDNIAVKLI